MRFDSACCDNLLSNGQYVSMVFKYYAQEIQHDESKRNNYGVAVP